MDFDKDIDRAAKEADPLFRVQPNLNPFLNRGGKLMLYVGWAEMYNGNNIKNFYTTVLENAGTGKENAVRRHH